MTNDELRAVGGRWRGRGGAAFEMRGNGLVRGRVREGGKKPSRHLPTGIAAFTCPAHG
jgi:hypothetical protein